MVLFSILLLFLTIAPAYAATSSIQQDLNDTCHVNAGERTALVFQGDPDESWGPKSGYLWEYRLPGTEEWIPLSQERLEVLEPSTDVQIDGVNARIDIDNPHYDDRRVTTLVIEKTPAKLNGTQFRVTIGQYHQEQSVVATLYVDGGIEIDAKTRDSMAFEGQNVELSVETNTTGVTYQWYRGNADPTPENRIEDAVGKILTLETVTQKDAGTYTVVIAAPGGETKTATCNLTVFEPPTVSPKDAAAGSEITFKVNGSAFYDYRWYKGKPNTGTPVGEGGQIYMIETANADSAGEYYLMVTDANGQSITSNPIELNIVSLSMQPKNTYAFVGQAASFDVTAPEGAILTEYQWYKGTPESKTIIENAVSSKLLFDQTINPVKKSDEGTYFVTVSQTFGTEENAQPVVLTSEPAKLTVFELTSSKSDVIAGENVTFTVDGGEQEPAQSISETWYKNNGSGWKKIEGAANRIYEIKNISGDENGAQFFVRLEIGDQTLDSNVLTLTVSPDNSGNDGGDDGGDDGGNNNNGGNSGGQGGAKVLPKNPGFELEPESKAITVDTANDTNFGKPSVMSGFEKTKPDNTNLLVGAASIFAIACIFLLLVVGRKKRKEEEEEK